MHTWHSSRKLELTATVKESQPVQVVFFTVLMLTVKAGVRVPAYPLPQLVINGVVALTRTTITTYSIKQEDGSAMKMKTRGSAMKMKTVFMLMLIFGLECIPAFEALFGFVQLESDKIYLDMQNKINFKLNFSRIDTILYLNGLQDCAYWRNSGNFFVLGPADVGWKRVMPLSA